VEVVYTHVSLLRGVNVGGRRMVKMDELKHAYIALGLENVRTYVQSGNVIFESSEGDPRKLEVNIQKGLKKAFDLDTVVLLRTREAMQTAIDGNPFEGKDEGKLHVTFLSAEPETVPLEEFDKAKTGGEELVVRGTEVYLFLPNGYGRTKLNNNYLERKLRVAATTRNWRTARALLTMAGSSGE
jgi:uncharacterized protein (DUF1697 family)